MDKFLITGGNPLKGEVHISGAKNAAVAILPAALLISGRCIIENVPDISDVDSIVKMIISLGAKVIFSYLFFAAIPLYSTVLITSQFSPSKEV